jgi:DeoR/GlpR family transcriptional regulator of sugar metabolism
MQMKKDFAEERRTKLLEYVNSHNRADVAELASFAQVTEATIRRDLILMENDKLIYRTHGGALQREQRALWQTTTLQERSGLYQEEKERIGQFVSQLVRDGESLMIDGGSTTLVVARHLGVHQKLLIVTNTATIGELLVGNKNNQVILTGGELIAGTNTMVGPSTELALRQYRTDKAIIGVSGILLGQGCFSAIPQEAEIKKLMIHNARETIIVSDSSKIGTSAFCFVCEFNAVSKLVTDRNISKTARESLETAGIEVFCV